MPLSAIMCWASVSVRDELRCIWNDVIVVICVETYMPRMTKTDICISIYRRRALLYAYYFVLLFYISDDCYLSAIAIL